MAHHGGAAAAHHHVKAHHDEEHHHQHHEDDEGVLEQFEELFGMDDDSDTKKREEPVTEEEKTKEHRLNRVYEWTTKQLQTVAQMQQDAEIYEDLDEHKGIDNWGKEKFGVEHFGPRFGFIVTSFVLLNAITIGIETDATNPSIKSVLRVLEHVYCAVFTVECIVRIWVDKMKYFTTPITCIDFMLVCSAILDTWIMPLVASRSGLGKLSLLRVIRLLRLVRLIKLARALKQLYLLVCGLMAGLSTLLWVFLLMSVTLYMCAVFCVQIIGHDPDVWEDEEEFDPLKYFGNIGNAMLALWECLNDGCTGDIVRPVVNKKPWMILFFLAFVFILIYGFLNILVGVFVDSTMESANEQEGMIRRQQELVSLVDKEALKQLWEVVNKSGGMYISKRDFLSAYNRTEVHEVILKLELGEIEAVELFSTLDVNNDNRIKLEEMVEGVMRFRAALRQPEVATYMHEKKSEAQMTRCFDKILRLRQVLAKKGVELPERKGKEKRKKNPDTKKQNKIKSKVPDSEKTVDSSPGPSVLQKIPGVLAANKMAGVLHAGSFIEEDEEVEGSEEEEEEETELERIQREIDEDIAGQTGYRLKFVNDEHEEAYLLSLAPSLLQWLKVSLAVLSILFFAMMPVDADLPESVIVVRALYRAARLAVAAGLTRKLAKALPQEEDAGEEGNNGRSCQDLMVWALLLQAVSSAVIRPDRLAEIMSIEGVESYAEFSLWWEGIVVLFSVFGTSMPCHHQFQLLKWGLCIKLIIGLVLDAAILKLPLDLMQFIVHDVFAYAFMSYVLARAAYNFDLDRRRSYLLQQHLELLDQKIFEEPEPVGPPPSSGFSGLLNKS